MFCALSVHRVETLQVFRAMYMLYSLSYKLKNGLVFTAYPEGLEAPLCVCAGPGLAFIACSEGLAMRPRCVCVQALGWP